VESAYDFHLNEESRSHKFLPKMDLHLMSNGWYGLYSKFYFF